MNSPIDVAVIGAGPAGLMAAQVLSRAGVAVQVFDAMPSVGRKFLLAGKGGLNLTHAEPMDVFTTRYGKRSPEIARWLADFGADSVREWAKDLGVDTFVGSSGHVFPTDMKAAPLLRSWLQRLRRAGVQFHMRHRWTGWEDENLTHLSFDTPNGKHSVTARFVVLALGGGSWARLGSDGAWVPWLQARGVDVAPLLPANCGFDVQGGWSEHFSSRFAGQPFKSVAITCGDAQNPFHRKGEFVATATGVEGSLIYAASSLLRDEMVANGSACFYLDLLPHLSPERVLAEVQHPRGSRSLSSHLKSRLKIDGIKAGILHELLPKTAFNDPVALASALKALPITLGATRPLDEAISSAGGVRWNNHNLEILPHVFCAGEMLDWEAPTGGYLLTSCLASGYCAGYRILDKISTL